MASRDKTKTNGAKSVKRRPHKKEPQQVSGTKVYTKPGLMKPLFTGFREGEVVGEIIRPRMLTESVENGIGKATILDFSFRKFKDQPKAVFFLTWPKGVAGGSFEPTDRLLKPGEPINLSYTIEVKGVERPVYFVGKAYYLRKSFYVADAADSPGKPWTGPREKAREMLPKEVMVRGVDIIEIRVDSLTSMSSSPGSVPGKVLERYLSRAQLYIVPNGGAWAQRSTQGNYFKNIRDPLDKYLEKESFKLIEDPILEDFGNMGNVSIVVKDKLLAGIDDDKILRVMVEKPNDYLREINTAVGFLLYFQISDDIKNMIIRAVPDKVGAEIEVYLPLILERIADANGKYRLILRVFPRDLVENRSRTSMELGLHFKPPYTLHPGSENQTIYSKLVIALGQLFREDMKPEEEKMKSAKLQASVQARIAEQAHNFTDEKTKAAFQNRIAAKKREEVD